MKKPGKPHLYLVANSEELKVNMPSPQSPAVKGYLVLYNSVNAFLWLRILLTILTTHSDPALYTTLEPQARWVQTLAVVEILHAATGKDIS